MMCYSAPMDLFLILNFVYVQLDMKDLPKGFYYLHFLSLWKSSEHANIQAEEWPVVLSSGFLL